MSADDALDEARLPEAIEPAPREGIALPNAEEQCQVGWLAEACRFLVARLVNLAEFVNDLLRNADAAEPANGDGVAGANQAHRLARRHDLAGLARPRGWND